MKSAEMLGVFKLKTLEEKLSRLKAGEVNSKDCILRKLKFVERIIEFG